MAKKPPEFHIDLLGQEICIGNYVVASYKNSYSSTLTICRVTRLTEKKVCLKGIQRKDEWLDWPHETVKLSGEDILAFILKYE
jgi:hypothetical protein